MVDWEMASDFHSYFYIFHIQTSLLIPGYDYFVRFWTDAVNFHGCMHTMPVHNKQPLPFHWERKAHKREENDKTE